MGDKGLLFLLFAALAATVGCWNLYRSEKRKEKKLAESVQGEREFYQAFIRNQTECYLYLRKSDQRVLYISPNFEKLTGISEKMMKEDPESLKELLDHSMRRSVGEALAGWDHREMFRMEVDFQLEGSAEKGRAAVFISDVDEMDSYLIILRDITEEYAARRKTEEQMELARQESQSKTDFLSKMSHEIRTPMNGILGMLNLVRAHMDQKKEAEEYLNKTEELSKFLLNLINDILDMSRIESGRMQLEQEPFDLYGLADKLDAMFQSTAQAKGIHWKVELLDMKDRYVIGDEMRLSQVIINFISNANKFTPEGGSVSVTFREMDRIDDEMHLMIRVRDTGKGIREDFISKIFRPFEQEDASTAHNYGGSGLGMAIADNMIKLMNGEIMVESEPGKGTEFTVYLTLPIAEEQTVVETETVPQVADDFTLDGIRILLAEDNDINAEIAIEILEMEGAVLTRANDGAEAVRMFTESAPGSFDVILMDIQMPVMNGWEATEAIRKLERADAGLPILAMSANAFLEDQRHSIESGMDGHLNKPVDYEEVRRMIGQCLLERKRRQ